MASYGSIGNSIVTSKGSPDDKVDESKPLIDSSILTPVETKEGLWARLTFQWFTAILHIGNRTNRLNQEDLNEVPLPTDCETDDIIASFDKEWQEELQKEKPSLVKALTRAFGFEYFLAALLKLVHDLNVFVGPQVLHAIIVFLRNPQAPLWHGLGLTMVITISQMTMSLCLRHYFFKVRKDENNYRKNTVQFCLIAFFSVLQNRSSCQNGHCVGSLPQSSTAFCSRTAIENFRRNHKSHVD
jgi:hypothetical protein